MPKNSFTAGRLVIKDLPEDMKISADEMRKITGGMSFRPAFLSEEWLALSQQESEVNLRTPLSAALPLRCRRV
jgi:hypothetical protein